MTLKAGLIGLGGVSEAHLAAYSGLAGIEVVAAAESRQQRLEEMCALHGFRGYSDYHVMLESEDLAVGCWLCAGACRPALQSDRSLR